MDNLTHTLAGVALARLGLGKRVPGATLTLALASNFPDLDLITAVGGNLAYLEYHRGITHGLPASPFFAAALALVLSFWPKSPRRFLSTFLLAWLGICLHIVFDLWTSYGTRALLPLSATWYSWDWMFIVDPALLFFLVFACFGSRWFQAAKATRIGLMAALAYIGLRASAQSLAHGQAESFVGSEFETVRAFPDPVLINKWRFIAQNERTFASGYVTAVGMVRTKVTFQRTPPSQTAQRMALESRAARVFLDFSVFPRLEVSQDGGLTTIIWRDLRFAERRPNGFFCEVKVDATGRIISERVVF